MESLQAVKCCMRCRIVPSPSSSFRALRYSPGRRKPLATSKHPRLFSTTRTKSQEERTPTPPPESQSQSRTSQLNPPLRPNPFTSFVRNPRPHVTTPSPSSLGAAGELSQRLNSANTPSPSPSTRDPGELNQRLNSAMNLLDLVPRAGSRRFGNPGAGGDYSSSLTNQVGDNIARIAAQADHASLEGIHLRLTPMLGRTIAVGEANTTDLQSTFRALEFRCAQNSVKTDSMKQRTHVRKGQKRKQLKVTRWRALFKEGFIREVARIRRMKAQGW